MPRDAAGRFTERPDAVPATGRPPMGTPGNTATLKHGAHSERTLRPIVDLLRPEVLEAAPWVAAPAFRWTFETYLWAEARCVAYREWFAEKGMFLTEEDRTVQRGKREPGDPRPSLDRWDQAERTAARLREVLGLTPATLATLITKLASIEPTALNNALEQLRATGAELQAAAEAKALGPGPAAYPEDDDEEIDDE